MRTVPYNLQNAYYKLKKSKLVKENEIDSDSISYFESVLNSGLPKNDDEFIVYYFIKNLFYNDKLKFYNFINNSGFECLVLYTDNLYISNHFNLGSKVYISWNKDDKLYNVKQI
jgi:hypothetical protein